MLMPQRRRRNPLLLWELPRAALELASIPLATPALITVPWGDNHPVLVIPGFLGHDDHTRCLRGFLKSRGYQVHGWELGRNMGLHQMGGLDTLLARLDDIYQANDQTRVSIVGWSLGGVFARRLARARPEQVRQTISLGSPIGRINDPEAYTQTVYERIGDEVVPKQVIDQYLMENLQPCSVPATAIYSRSDAIVSHHIAKEPESDITENLEVISSHVGLVVNPQVFYLVGRKLAHPEDNWRKLRPLMGSLLKF